jgi:hypothetical protein
VPPLANFGVCRITIDKFTGYSPDCDVDSQPMLLM